MGESVVDRVVREFMEAEKVKAIKLADEVLDRPYGDPDDDLAVLARQFLEALRRLGDIRTPGED